MLTGRTKGDTAPNKGQSYPPEPLTGQEVLTLIDACSNRAPTGIRNRALIVVMWRGGLRIGEAMALKPKDVDGKAGTVRVLHGKGDKARLVGLDPEAMAVVQRWIDKRKAIGIKGRAPLFCTLAGGPVSAPYVRMMLKRKAEQVGIEKRVHPHGLRHSLAADLANEGVPIHEIQQQLGHGNVATTNTYLRGLNPKATIETMRARQWPLRDT